MQNSNAQPVTKWYDNKIVIHLLLFFFFPIGLFLLWRTNTIAKWWKLGATAIIALLVISGLLSDDKTVTTTAEAAGSKKVDSTAIKEAEMNLVKEKEEWEKYVAESKIKLEKLKKNFIYTEDEFKKIGFYTHKTFGKYFPNRKTLTAGLNSTGYIYLRSNYYGDDWLFHKSVQVKSGEIIFDSPVIEMYSKDHVTDNSGGSVWEENRYDDDNGIIQLIASSDKDEVKVRFIGRQYHDDVILSAKDKAAIKESYELSQLLKLINDPAMPKKGN